MLKYKHITKLLKNQYSKKAIKGEKLLKLSFILVASIRNMTYLLTLCF